MKKIAAITFFLSLAGTLAQPMLKKALCKMGLTGQQTVSKILASQASRNFFHFKQQQNPIFHSRILSSVSPRRLEHCLRSPYPLHTAVALQELSIALLLKESGHNPCERNNNGLTAFDIATKIGDPFLITILKKK